LHFVVEVGGLMKFFAVVKADGIEDYVVVNVVFVYMS